MTYAAENENSFAQYLLGICYVNLNDANNCFRWLNKSASNGNIRGQCKLGLCYLLGVGVNKDYNEAIYWLKKAAKADDEEAKKQLKKLNETW